MNKLMRFSSKSGRRFVDIVESKSGELMLFIYVKKYDPEEECYYEIRELPGPTGKYGDMESAIKEAKRLVEQ